MPPFLQMIGVQQQYQNGKETFFSAFLKEKNISFKEYIEELNKGDADKDMMPDKFDKWPGDNDFVKRKEAVQDIAGALAGEYYRSPSEFAENHALVKEIQDELVRLGYDLGKSGKNKNGVDGDLGAKTILALHNFELDHATEMKTAAEIQASIKKGKER